MYTKDIMDTINIIYNTYKHKTLKTHPKKPKVTDTIQAARTITKPDAPDKKNNVLAQRKKRLQPLLKKREGAKRQHTHTWTLLCPPPPPTPPETPYPPSPKPTPPKPPPNPQTPTQKSSAKNPVFFAQWTREKTAKNRGKSRNNIIRCAVTKGPREQQPTNARKHFFCKNSFSFPNSKPSNESVSSIECDVISCMPICGARQSPQASHRISQQNARLQLGVESTSHSKQT